MRSQIPRYSSLGATSLDCESGNNWGLHGRGYYVAHRLIWDPKADVDAIQGDFYAKAFGPAVAPMKRYYERFDPGNQPLMSEHLLALGFRDQRVWRAEGAVQSNKQTTLAIDCPIG